jgi:hypothetical protein
MYNCTGTESSVSATCRAAVVVSVLKPSRDNSHTSSYRIISCTSCMLNTMECMVNHRLLWVMESRNLVSISQRCCLIFPDFSFPFPYFFFPHLLASDLHIFISIYLVCNRHDKPAPCHGGRLLFGLIFDQYVAGLRMRNLHLPYFIREVYCSMPFYVHLHACTHFVAFSEGMCLNVPLYLCL